MKHLPIAFILSTAALSLTAAAHDFIAVAGTPEMFGANWNVASNLLPTHSGSDWSGSITPRAAAGEFKFVADKDPNWKVNWGGEFSVLRVPAYGVGPLSQGGANLSWANAAIGSAHTFVFHETSATFDIVPASAAAREFSSLQLVGNFNHRGADPVGALTKSGNLWKGEIEVPGGTDSFLLRVDNQELWGLAASRSAALPVDGASLCGSASLNVSGIKSGTLAVTFDPAKLLLSVSQKTTNAFVSKYIAADVSFAVGTPCDVNLEETDDGHWTADFVVTNATTNAFTLSLSQRDVRGNQGGYHWGCATTNEAAKTNTYPVSVFLSRTDDASPVLPVKCEGGTGRYRISFSPATQELSVRRLYYLSGRVNLWPDPSLEKYKKNDKDECIPADSGVSLWNARIVDASILTGLGFGAHSGNCAAFFPPAGGGQDNPSDFFGSLDYHIPVANAAGATLCVSACFRAYQSWEEAAQIQIIWKDANGTEIGEHRHDLLNFDPIAWKTYSTEATIPPNASVAKVVYRYPSAPASGGLLLDDLEVRLASSRNQNFDAWTSLLDKWTAFSPDWNLSRGKTVDNSKDVALPPGSLLISKYIEGTGNNKAIEIFNGTDASVDLSQYNLAQYDNGTNTPSSVINLAGTLAPGACFVVTRPVHNANYPPDPALLAAADASGMTSKLLTFNGDDVIVLRKGTTVLDRVGQVSSSATSAFWAYVCKNRTLVRKSTVHTGTVSAVTAAFDFSQWDLLPCDDFTDLGSHSRSLDDDVFVPSGLSLVLYDNATLVSPMLDGGIGDLSFWYRAATSTNAADATLRVEAAADESFSAPVLLATLTVPPTLVSFTNFSLFLNRSDLSFLRFVETTGAGSSHVRLDDISVTPAVAASRYQDFNAWTNSSWAAYDGNYSLASWTISNGRIAPTAGSSGTPAARLKPDASLTSPVFASGIGTVVFLAARDASAGSSDPAKITFQITSDGGASWTDADSISVTNTTWTSLTVSADIPSSASVRFLSSGDSPLLLDNIELRVYEGAARSQNFNTWSVNSSYTNRTGQGWTASSAAVDAGPDGNCLRMKASGATITSPIFSGGLGTLSLDAKSYSSSHDPSFTAEISTNAGTTWTTLFTGSLSTSDLSFRSFSQLANNPAVNRVRIRLTSSKIIHLDNIVCGIIKPPSSVTVSASVSPDPLDLENPFAFSASVQPSGDAAVSAVSVRWQTVVGKTTNAWTTNALSYAAASDRWVSPSFAPLAEGTRLHYQAFASWSSAEYSTNQTTYSDVCTNLASSVAGGGVWINEIFYKYHDADRTSSGGDCDPDENPFGCEDEEGETSPWELDQQNHEYVEICGPANQSIAGWSLRFEFARAQEIGANSNIARYASVSLPPNAALTNNVKDGYGFYIVGDVNTNWAVNRSIGSSYVPANVDADAAEVRNNIYDSEGVIRLFNNNGSQIDAISYGRNYGALTNAGNQTETGFHSLSLAGSNGYHASSFAWDSSLASPGRANDGQTFTNRPVSVRTLPSDARHAAAEKVTPSSGQIAPFYMLDPQPARVADLLDFAVAFPAAYGDKSSGALFYRREDANAWVSNSLAFYDGARNKSGEDFLHLRNPLPAYTFKRLETVSYYFSVTPADSSYLTGYLASDGAGGSLVYSNETDAISNPFTVTFPFHDEFYFLSFAPAPAGNRWFATLVDDGEFDTPPAWDELRLEVNTNGLVASNAWTSWAFEPEAGPDKNVDEKLTTYGLSIDLPPSPAFFRVAPARQPLGE